MLPNLLRDVDLWSAESKSDGGRKARGNHRAELEKKSLSGAPGAWSIATNLTSDGYRLEQKTPVLFVDARVPFL